MERSRPPVVFVHGLWLISHSTLKLYRKSPAVTDLKEFPDRGHSLALDSGWRDVADATLAWLESQSI